MSVALAASTGFSLWQSYLGSKSRNAQLEAQAQAGFENAATMRLRSRENLRRVTTSLLQAPKELERRKAAINNISAAQNIKVEEDGDLILSEAGSILQETSFALEEATANYLIEMKSASNQERQANQMKDASKEKFLGIF